MKKFKVPRLVKAIFFWGAFFILLFLFAYQMQRSAQIEILTAEYNKEKKAKNQPAIDFGLAQILKPNEEIKLSKFKGTFTLLHFWASWCAPCKEEMPLLEQLAKKFKGKLNIVTISSDQEIADVINFWPIASSNMWFLYDPEQKVASMYQVDKFPESILIDKNGQIFAHFIGAKNWISEEWVMYFEQTMHKP